MNLFRRSLAGKLTALLLAVLLLAAAPMSAFAAEGEGLSSEASALEPSAPESSLSESDGSEPAEDGASSASPEQGEDAAEEEESLQEAVETGLSSAAILITGGHEPYISGYDNGLFQPAKAMSRAEAAQMLYNLLASKPAVSSSRFSDVAITSWYGVPVNTLAEKGVIGGYEDGTFLPNKPISRAEFVKILVMCFELEPGSSSFSDSETHWAHPYISAAVSAGWIGGYPDGTFRPNRGIKRCEAVKVLNLALGRTGEGYAVGRDEVRFSDVPKSHWAFLDVTEAAGPSTPTDPDPDPDVEFEVGQTVRITASALNFRNGPGTGYSQVGTLYNGTVVTVLSVSDLPWLEVKTSSGDTGYICAYEENHMYVESYTPGTASGASLSSDRLTLHQYESARLDASVTAGLESMSWSSSDPDVAIVGYTVGYGRSYPNEQGAMIYGKSPGTATLTFSDSAGKTKATCTVVVTAPEGVRFAYGDCGRGNYNIVKGQSFDLVAVTGPEKTSVSFQIVAGPATGSWTTSTAATETRPAARSLPANTVKVFKRSVAFSTAGTYTIRAAANGSSDYCDFKVCVNSAATDVTAVSFEERAPSRRILELIAAYEGSLKLCEDDLNARKNPTVGYGYVVPKNGKFYNNLTDAELWGLLYSKVWQTYAPQVNSFRRTYELKMSQAQFDALVCFTYNLGTGNLFVDYGFRRAMFNAAAVTASESAPVTGTVNMDGAVLYDQASLSGKSLGGVKLNDSVTIVGVETIWEKQQIWYKVQYNSKTGWIAAGNVNIPRAARDLSYVDSTVMANNLLQWCHAGTTVLPGLVWRRLAECKLFFFGDYEEADPASPNYHSNTYGFHFPDEIKSYDR